MSHTVFDRENENFTTTKIDSVIEMTVQSSNLVHSLYEDVIALVMADLDGSQHCQVKSIPLFGEYFCKGKLLLEKSFFWGKKDLAEDSIQREIVWNFMNHDSKSFHFFIISLMAYVTSLRGKVCTI